VSTALGRALVGHNNRTEEKNENKTGRKEERGRKRGKEERRESSLLVVFVSLDCIY
jgi:hypothetical protein